MAFAAFMATALGRSIRVVFGVVLILVSLVVIGGAAGWIAAVTGLLVATIGVVLIAVGVFNVCLIALLIGAPFSGREALQRQQRTPLQESRVDQAGS